MRTYLLSSPMVVCLCVVDSGAMQTADGNEKAAWIRLVASKDEVARQNGKRSSVQERARSIGALLKIVNAPLVKGEQFYIMGTRRNTAISLLGHLRAKEAVPALMKWVVPKEGQREGIDDQALLGPAASALAEIGLPAAGHLLDKMCLEGMSPLGRECLKTFVWTMGLHTAEFRLSQAVRSEVDAQRKQNISACLEALRKRDKKLPPILWDRPWGHHGRAR